MKYIGKGIYTCSEASLITGVKSNTIRRWVEGYSGSNTRDNISPVFQTDFEKIDTKKALSFMDVIEILFIKAFIGHGLSIQLIRKAIDRASLLLSSEHPFAMKKFYTDGKTILARIGRESELPELIDLIKQQYQFDEIVLPQLYGCIDFDSYDVARRYWPEGKQNKIIIDPNVNFGEPSIAGVNVPLRIIMKFVSSGQSITEIADWYDIDAAWVKQAIDFEKNHAA